LIITISIIPFLPYEGAIKAGVAVMTLSNVFLTLSQILATIFQKTLTTEKLVIAEIVGRLSLLGTTILVVYSKASLLWVVLTVVAGSFASFLVTYGYSRPIISLKLQIDWGYWKDILNRTWPVAISIIFGVIYFKADTFILSLTRPQAEVGIYGLPYRVLETAIMVPLIVMGLVLPLLASSWAKNEMDKFKHYMKHAFDGIVIIALPMIFGTLLLARPIINLIGGAEFDVSARVLRILIVATGVIFISSLFTYAILAIGKQRVMIKYYLFTAIIAVAAYLYFIPRYTY
jgi:O-antigen/teichoic acid export membrane protein